MGNALSPLASVSTTRSVMERHGLGTKKALGQHFLINDGIVRHICELSGVQSDDEVLEIGPGIGTLTVALLQKARRVIAVERDPDLVPILNETCAAWRDSLAVLQKDALQLYPKDMDEQPRSLIANLPYAVAATLVLDCFQRFESLESATVMVQAEVADRIAASPGVKDYGAFTVKLGLYAHPVGRFAVSPGNFFPPPRVNSAVIRLDRIDLGSQSDETIRQATTVMADAAFASRRKTIANSSLTYFVARKGTDAKEELRSTLSAVFEEAHIDPRRRGETLSLDEFMTLGRVAYQHGLVSSLH